VASQRDRIGAGAPGRSAAHGSDLFDIYRSSGTAARLAELHELVQPTLELLARALGYERAFVCLVDVEAGSVSGMVGVNPPDGLLETDAFDLPEHTLFVEALRGGRPLRVDDAMRDPRVPEAARPHYAGYGLIAFAAVPLPPASGVLVVCRERPIGEREVNELLPYAAQLVAAVTARGEVRRLSAADEEHAVAEEWLWWLVNAVQDPALLTDEANNILLANQHAERLLKPGPDDSAGKRYAIEINNVLLSASLSSFALEHEGGASRELTLVDPIEGTELLFELIRKPATNLRTGERAQACVLKDVTDLRRALDELKQTLSGLEAAGEQARQERDRLDLILSNVADPIVVADPDGQIMRMNQPAARLLQAGAAGAPADVSTAYLANDARFSSFLSQLRLESSAGKQGEIQLVDPETGELLTMSLTATEVQERLGQVTAIVCVLHDLTRVRELERRTLEQQLFESEKLAAVGRLAAATAHEINNPLEAIKNALYLLISRTAADDPNHQFLEIASRETERVSTIMRQMLGFYRPVVEKSITDVNQVLGEALALLDRQLRQARIGVRTRLDPALPAILASADQLKQVFLNLLLNARDAMPEGGTIRITTRMTRDTDTEFIEDGRRLLVQFQDTGSGISEENLRYIFEPFFSTKSEAKGTGLGLWVSLGIVRQHGGQLNVMSRAGRGTTFTVALPAGAPPPLEAPDG